MRDNNILIENHGEEFNITIQKIGKFTHSNQHVIAVKLDEDYITVTYITGDKKKYDRTDYSLVM